MELLTAQDVMERINNRFVKDCEEGTFTIEDGSISASLLPEQYFWVEGSYFNDGLHRFTDDDPLKDETFTGAVYTLSIPKTFVKLVEDMEEWTANHPAAASGYTSESFGGYSYSLPTNSNTGMAATVYDVFGSRLNKWRRLPCL